MRSRDLKSGDIIESSGNLYLISDGLYLNCVKTGESVLMRQNILDKIDENRFSVKRFGNEKKLNNVIIILEREKPYSKLYIIRLIKELDRSLGLKEAKDFFEESIELANYSKLKFCRIELNNIKIDLEYKLSPYKALYDDGSEVEVIIE